MIKYTILYTILIHLNIAQVLIENVRYPVEDAATDYLNILRVKNGKPANLTSVPYVVSFKMKHGNIYYNFCGGTLITTDTILSAAHCFTVEKKCCGIIKWGYEKRTLVNMVAVMGDLNNRLPASTAAAPAGRPPPPVTATGQYRWLRSANVPLNYAMPKNDIAVVTVTEPFVLNDVVKTIPYASVSKNYRGTCLVAGFGRTETNVPSPVLLFAAVTLSSDYHCRKAMGNKVAKGLICASQWPSDSGKGDSGGPLVCSGTGDPAETDKKVGLLVGIVSGAKGKTSFYTKVGYHRSFMQKNVATLPPPPSPCLHLCAVLTLLTLRHM